jgi:hypothetical protein
MSIKKFSRFYIRFNRARTGDKERLISSFWKGYSVFENRIVSQPEKITEIQNFTYLGKWWLLRKKWDLQSFKFFQPKCFFKTRNRILLISWSCSIDMCTKTQKRFYWHFRLRAPEILAVLFSGNWENLFYHTNPWASSIIRTRGLKI